MPHTLQEFHADFSQHCRFNRELSTVTLRAYRASFALLLRRYPNLTAEMLTPETLTDYFEWLRTTSRSSRQPADQRVKPSTLLSHWRRLSVFFDWLKSKHVLGTNPLKEDGMVPPKVRYEDRQYLDRSQVEKIVSAIAFGIRWQSRLIRTRNLALISIAVNCGLRRGELLG